MLAFLTACVGWFPIALEPPSFWTTIANDSRVDQEIRRTCIIRLVDRHASRGMSFPEFARLLNNPSWIKQKDLTNWNKSVLGGYIPVAIDKENSTTFCFRPFPDLPGDSQAVYFRVSGTLETDTCFRILRGEKIALKEDVLMVEVATSAGRDREGRDRTHHKFLQKP